MLAKMRSLVFILRAGASGTAGMGSIRCAHRAALDPVNGIQKQRHRLARDLGKTRAAPHLATQESQRYQRRCWLPVAPATPRYLCKVRRLRFQKAIQKQSLTRTTLKTRSAEVWRQSSREREFLARTGSPRCGGFAANGRVVGVLSALKSERRMLAQKGVAEGVSAFSKISNHCMALYVAVCSNL